MTHEDLKDKIISDIKAKRDAKKLRDAKRKQAERSLEADYNVVRRRYFSHLVPTLRQIAAAASVSSRPQRMM